MSPLAFVAVFSSSMFAVPTPPTSQPARVNGTHGAGVFLPPRSVTMFGFGSSVASTGSVQYLKDDENAGVPSCREEAVAVRRPYAVAVGVEAGEARQDPSAVCEIRTCGRS